ncbi:AsmA family protein [Marivirga arenosa]|uniref:AsmA-like C-terminal region-containing protein n=2 Tax=Marivirga arenosa TaxID=3059076 RepID=A0AA51ZX04_9BACT|nr:AsmA-like C-terminal region-containing protein [Marivirga sp. BKB1-2]WNB18236.1 AsmA-like C-terminal region-containing protein [Marivirga sp. BKB1-2]
MLLIIVIASAVIVTLAYSHQDTVVKEIVNKVNHDFKGRIEIYDSHISPFQNFPYISIDLEDVKIFESKEDSAEMLLHIEDIYLGFDILSIINGSYEAKKIKLSEGYLKLVQHIDGSFNILNAITNEGNEDETTDSESTHLDLQAIELENIDLLKLNEENNILIEAFIEKANSSFMSTEELMEIKLESNFLFNLILDNDTSFLHHKHVSISTRLKFDAQQNKLAITPSELLIEKALFMMEGSIDVDDDMNLDLHFNGNKPNFDLFLAFAPEEINPVLDRYDNGGKIYFDATVKGKSINNYSPQIQVDFGCSEAFINNTSSNKAVNDLYFKGRFTNGEKRDPSTMELVIEDFSAKPETGVFSGNIEIKNFESPEFDIQLISEFDLGFLAQFLNINNLEESSGFVSLEMNFHDIIDLTQPEKSIERLNESYFTKLKVQDLNIQSSVYPLPIKNVNIRAQMDGHRALIDQLDFEIGKSDISINGSLSDLPAIIHHTNIPVDAVLNISSNTLDIEELSSTSSDSAAGFKEKIKDLSMRFTFKSSAKAFTESPNLPLGEFFIEKLHAQLTNYPHELHDFNADVFIDTANFRVIDFTGMIDESDFHFNGKLENYDLWFEETPIGDTKIDFNLNSELIQLEDLFTYGGENYVPEDYRHEEFSELQLHGLVDMKFNEKLISTQVDIDRLASNMKVHPMRFEDFKGSFFMDSNVFKVTDASGKIGNSDFRLGFTHYNNDSISDIPNSLSFSSTQLDFDQLFAYNPPPEGEEIQEVDHEAGFNIFEVPFKDMDFDLNIDDLNYHRIHLRDFALNGRMQSDHYIYLDTLSLKSAGGSIGLNGYFNGSNPKAIYFSPNMELNNIDLDQLLFKFENFGQDHLVSENLHGRLSGSINGKIHLHADMVPIIDDSELHIEMKVVEGSINNYSAFEALSDYFSDKNLSIVRFDTLQNTLDLSQGSLSIPAMTINSSLGYFEVSGDQNTDLSMDYYVRIPINVITKAGMNKVFGKKNKVDSTQIDDIIEKDIDKKTRYLNLRITGTPEEYSVLLGKDRK